MRHTLDIYKIGNSCSTAEEHMPRKENFLRLWVPTRQVLDYSFFHFHTYLYQRVLRRSIKEIRHLSLPKLDAMLSCLAQIGLTKDGISAEHSRSCKMLT